MVNTDFCGSRFGEIHVPWDWKELNKPLDPDPVDLEDVQAEVDKLSTSWVNARGGGLPIIVDGGARPIP